MVTLSEMKAHLRITDNVDDAIIASKLAVASEWVAVYTGGSVAGVTTPAPVNEAVRQIAAHLYENREASLIGVTAQELPFGVLDLLSSYQAYAF